MNIAEVTRLAIASSFKFEEECGGIVVYLHDKKLGKDGLLYGCMAAWEDEDNLVWDYAPCSNYDGEVEKNYYFINKIKNFIDNWVDNLE